jgi:hypothetical protein
MRDVALVGQQIQLEQLYNKNQLLPRLRLEFETIAGGYFLQLLEDKQIPRDFGIDMLCQIALHRRCKAEVLIGVLKNHFRTIQECADMLTRALHADLLEWNEVLQVFIVRYVISDDLQEELDRYQFPLPMVVEPRAVIDNRGTGYLTSHGSIILKDNHHKDDVCLDHINRVNLVALSLDYDTGRMMSNRWRNLDKAKPGESRQDFDKRRKAFEKYDRVSKAVMQLLTKITNRFYLTHRYDKRGRTYCQGYHVNYQGNPWNKAVIELADRELIP